MSAYLTEKAKIYGALAPVNAAAGAWVGKPVRLDSYNRVLFLVYLGVVDSTGALTVEKGTSSSLGTAIVFNYRIATTGATAFSELDGAITAAASTAGITLGTIPATPSNKVIAIEITAAELGAYNFVGVKIAASGSANTVAIVAILYEPRNAQALPIAAV